MIWTLKQNALQLSSCLIIYPILLKWVQTMAKLTALTNTWEIVKEVDLQPLREEALGGIKIVIIGRQNSGRTTLAS